MPHRVHVPIHTTCCKGVLVLLLSSTLSWNNWNLSQPARTGTNREHCPPLFAPKVRHSTPGGFIIHCLPYPICLGTQNGDLRDLFSHLMCPQQCALINTENTMPWMDTKTLRDRHHCLGHSRGSGWLSVFGDLSKSTNIAITL